MNKLRVAAYCRVSTDHDDQANSLESQRNYFKQYIEQHDSWELVKVYFDEGLSGTQTKKRIGFNEMIGMALSGHIDLIITKEVSRFARNTVDTLSITRKLREHNVGVIFTIDNIDTRDSDGELRLTIMASLAQEESRKTSERVKWGQRRRMEAGKVFGRDLLGYHVKDGKLYIDDEEAETVRLIFHKYLNENKGTGIIARELREAGIGPKRVNKWSNTVILRVLRNEKYVGDLLQKKTITPNYLNHKKKYNRGEEDMVYIKDHHEPIIDRKTWDLTQAELLRRQPSKEQRAKHSNRYWCSGKVLCGLCGTRYVARKKRVEREGICISWRCLHNSAGKMFQEQNCHNNSISNKALTHCMKIAIAQVQTNSDAIKNEVLSEINALKQEIRSNITEDTISKKKQEIEKKMSFALDALYDNTISESEFVTHRDRYRAQLDSLNEQLVKIKEELYIKDRQIEEIAKYAEEIDNMLSVSGESEELYGEVLDYVIINPNHVVTVWLKGIPVGIKMHYEARGRAKNYKTIVDSIELVDSDEKLEG